MEKNLLGILGSFLILHSIYLIVVKYTGKLPLIYNVETISGAVIAAGICVGSIILSKSGWLD